eukprot:TRINITY_DN90_c2_g1_i2.p1 TRINITY_DN90_c2_g1~~TRINITY_DN90_c2_g1_i2.p1  ORF type:complete len:855 (-),score=84.66 TRINITY_DN90_c2_g1_i2:386-2809(-)
MKIFTVLLGLLVLDCVSAQRVNDPYPKQTGFVRVYDNKFVTDDCKEFFFTGFNAWELIEGAIGFPKVLPDDVSFLGDQNLLEYIFDICERIGLNVVRFFGHGTTSDISTQKYCCPGEYKEEVLQGLDYILDQAAQRDLKVVLTFGDNWRSDFPDTVMYYVNHSDTATTFDDFWVDETTKQLYKNHIEFMVSRVNTFNNRTYKDDPTIFAWNVMNEPRCHLEECTEGTLLADWIDEMAAFIKSVDPNHMITVGEEGFYKPGCEQQYNPGEWAEGSGQDSLQDHASEHIDYIATHIWPDNWGRTDMEFLQAWLQAKVLDAETLQKPVVIEEFGKGTESMEDAVEIATVRNPVFAEVYQSIEDSITNDGYLRGGLFWTFNYGQPHEWSFGYGIRLGDSTWEYIQAHAQLMAMKTLTSKPVIGCEPGRGPTTSSSAPRPVLTPREDPETCCSGDCGAMTGWLQGDVTSGYGQKNIHVTFRRLNCQVLQIPRTKLLFIILQPFFQPTCKQIAAMSCICTFHNKFVSIKPTCHGLLNRQGQRFRRKFLINVSCTQQQFVQSLTVAEGNDNNEKEKRQQSSNHSKKAPSLKMEQRRLKRKLNQARYRVGAIVVSSVISLIAVLTTYYRFLVLTTSQNQFPWTEFSSTMAFILGGIVLMEYYARWAHKHVWHDFEPGYFLHKSHHQLRKGLFEANDIYAVVNAVPAMALCLWGFFTPGEIGGLAFGAGMGISFYGILYLFVHDGLVHNRFPTGAIGEWPYMKKVAAAHKIHHYNTFDGVPFGLFLGPQELKDIGQEKELMKVMEQMELRKARENA